MGADRLPPEPIRMIKEALVGLCLVLVAQVEVTVLDEALGGEQIKGFVSCYGRASAGPDVDGE